MNGSQKIPIHHEDTGELLGFVFRDSVSWDAQTIFGYSITHADDQTAAEKIIREKGLSFLTGTWQYLDNDDKQWHTCILKEVYEHKVAVIRTTAMGYQDPDDYKTVVINAPTETSLIKT